MLLFTNEAYRTTASGAPQPVRQPNPETIPAEYRAWLGRITPEDTVPQLKRFAEAGGTILAIGSSTALAGLLGVPVSDHLIKPTPDGGTTPLPRNDFYVPGSLIRVKVDTSHPLAHGMAADALVFFEDSPVFHLPASGVRQVAGYSGTDLLASGWAWGQEHLDGGAAVAEAKVGEGEVVLFGPEVAFRAQSHGTFKLLFNAIYFGTATSSVGP